VPRKKSGAGLALTVKPGVVRQAFKYRRGGGGPVHGQGSKIAFAATALQKFQKRQNA
jgi:hypothetical protein